MEKTIHSYKILFSFLIFLLTSGAATAQVWEVTRTDDPTPDGCNSGTDCSLREAIIAANDVGSGTTTIQLEGGQTYTLSIPNPYPNPTTIEEFLIATGGSLKIVNTDATIRIEATGSGMATIDANEIDRVFLLFEDTEVEMEDLVITGGKPGSGGGGGIYVVDNTNLEITNSSITNNSAGEGNSRGGGITGSGAVINISGSTFSNNMAGFMGGGIYLDDFNDGGSDVLSSVVINNSLFSENLGESYGGAIVVTGNTILEIFESTIEENRTYSNGGGIYSTNSNTTIKNSAIINNLARADGGSSGTGGGISVYGSGEEPGVLTIINTTISGNVAGNESNSGSGGGIYSGNRFIEATTNIINSTITDNSAWSGGGINLWGGIMNISNTIIANQSFGGDCSISSGGDPVVHEYTSLGYNISSDGSCGFGETGDQQNIDPLLGSLQDNGGPVFTHALSTNPISPAINNGSNSLYAAAGGDLVNDSDANGNDRVYNGGTIDIGAFEVQQNVSVVGCPATSDVLYVKKGETGSGANWFDALGELRDALAFYEDETCTIEDADEIWVAAGTYLPTDDTGNREATFNIFSELDILGGFVGTETNKNQRNWESNVTILSGDIDGDETLDGNSYHVVTATNGGFSGLLSGFTITGGNANGSAPHDKGGGLYASNGSVASNNINFENNYAETAGGGAYVIETVDRIGAQHPRFFQVEFTNNESGEDGGGLALENADSRISAVKFENNSANQFGGGLYTAGSFGDLAAPVLKNVIFKGNSANSQGGGMATNYSSPELYNALFTQNTARTSGGAIDHALSGTLLLYNTTISGNEAELSNGGGIYNRSEAVSEIHNSIIWGNTAGGTGNEIWNAVASSAELFYSLYGNGDGDIVEGGGFTATNSLTSDPVFSDIGSQDFSLLSTSPAINMGDPDTDLSDFRVITSDAVDLAVNPRIYNGDVDIIDMGAYEFQGNVTLPDSCPATNGVLFVKKGANGTGSGWNNALGELRDIYALFDSEDCTTEEVDEVWVAAGIYLPDGTGSDREATFLLLDGVDFYGGFEGVVSETSINDRNWETYQTILSGDIDTNEEPDGNSYNIVKAIEHSTETIFDGFIVVNGYADGANTLGFGAGLYADEVKLNIRNTIFENNTAQGSGGGVFVRDSGEWPVFTNVSFIDNVALTGVGGGLSSTNNSLRVSHSLFTGNQAAGASSRGGGASFSSGSPIIEYTEFLENSTQVSGGGLYLSQTEAFVRNSTFQGNQALIDETSTGAGGGISFNQDASTIMNVLVSGNLSYLGGGVYFDGSNDAVIINTTISGNEATSGGGGVQFIDSSPDFQNVIIWGNTSGAGFPRGDNFNMNPASGPVVSYSMIDGCYMDGNWVEFCGADGGNNIPDTDPLFVESIDTDNVTIPTTAGDFILTEASPLINVGNNSSYTSAGGDVQNDSDLSGGNRVFDVAEGGIIDLGAYEFQGESDPVDPEEPEFAPFITIWKTDNPGLSENNQISIPLVADGYDFTVDWGDGSDVDDYSTNYGENVLHYFTHTYSEPGTYTVAISGDFPRIYFNNLGDREKILDVMQWGDIEWQSMEFAFYGASNLNVTAKDAPDLSQVTSLREMFREATVFNGNIGHWNTETIESMESMFQDAPNFNADISAWDVENVTDMHRMFQGASVFNQELGGETGWNTENVLRMSGMFRDASAFNGDISSWNTSNVATMQTMFRDAGSFNQDISGWNVGSVETMTRMFMNAEIFDQDLSSWNIGNVETMEEMFDNSGLSTENYDTTLIGWAALAGDSGVQSEVDLGAAGLTYCAGADARDILMGAPYNWEISGDALSEICDEFQPFITTWQVEAGDLQISIPMIGNGYDFTVDWGDGNEEDYDTNPGNDVEHSLSHTYSEAGEYSVSISGDFPRIYINNEISIREKILDITQWGDIEWASMERAFYGARNLEISAEDTPDLSNVSSMRQMFRLATSLNSNIGHWNTETITDMNGLFWNAEEFDQNIGNWETGLVTDMMNMFDGAETFNQDISEWNTQNVETTEAMFRGTKAFNQDLNDWNTGNITDMSRMFNNAEAFNGDISSWNTENVETMRNMFGTARVFNQDISGWVTDNVTDMSFMFAYTDEFNADIGGWNTSMVESMQNMFQNTGSFNRDLSNWDVSGVISMGSMFLNAEAYNHSLGDWDIGALDQSVFLGGMTDMLNNSGLSTENYDATLLGWAAYVEANEAPADIELGAEGLTFCTGTDARNFLTGAPSNWTITGDALATGCLTPESEDQRILVSNAEDYEFSKSDFGVSNDSYFIKIETLPDEGTLLLDGNSVSADDQISVENINNGKFTWTMPEEEYGYGFTSFGFTVVNDNAQESEESYTLTIDLAATSVELTGGEGWRFLASPAQGETIGSFFDPIWTQGFAGSDNPGASFTNIQRLDQNNYAWEPVSHATNSMTVGQAVIAYVYSDDGAGGSGNGFPKTLSNTTANWLPLDGSFGGGLFYDPDQQENDDSFFLLGNPHPIAIDFCQTVRSEVASNAYFWDSSAGGGNGDYVNLSCDTDDDVEIAPFQGVWVRVTGATNNFEIPADAYMEGATSGYFKESSEDLPLLSFTVRGMEQSYTATTRILFDEDAKHGSDLIDAPKLSPAGLAHRYLSFYSLDKNNQPYDLQALPASMDSNIRIPLDIQTTESGTFTLEWSLPPVHVFGGNYFLRDNQTGNVIELREGSSYRFEITKEASIQSKDTESTHPMSVEAEPGAIALNTHQMSFGTEPRFEVLITTDGSDGFAELGDLPQAFTLNQNYPNPFNPTTIISYELPEQTSVRLEVYDMAGRQVATLVNTQMAAGRHTINFNAGNLSSGVYMYRLQAGSHIQTRKLTILK